jgi:phage shock protein PspC (stress-responsive transcriptional regulator)
MKKVININFQGRVIPIEETAYDILQQYIDSLRKYFANEEGRDEIVNDIESRIAELFSERLKKGATCITDDDVNAVIASMGRPADFEQADAEAAMGGTTGGQRAESTYTPNYTATPGRGRLYRNADDKIVGGVCSGLANYLGIDPIIMRILFVIFFGALFWVYIILWIIVPSQSIQTNTTKRLYRSADDKVIGGVCGGLAAYFNINTWIPRLIFALPLIIGIVSGPFNFWWGDWDFWWGPKFVTGSLSFTLFVTYVILWIAVPVAVTAFDLNSIRDTVKEDLESLKTRAQNFGSEVKQSAQNLGERAKTYGQAAGAFAANEAAPVARSAGSSIGRIIGILFKAFFLFVAGIIAISLFGVLMGLLFGGFVAFPFKDFVLDGFWQNVFAWLSLILFLGIPIIALITWLIRRIAGIRSRNHYLGYVFGSLWTIGLISFILLLGSFSRNFKTGSEKQEEVTISQPSTGKLLVDVAPNNIRYYGGDWFGVEWDEDFPVYGINQDTLMLNTVRVNIVQSRDSLFRVHKVSFSRGRNPETARQLAEKINFNITQRDSTLVLPKGFAISREEKFRNQRVLVVIEVPVGKRIQLDRSLDSYEWFTVNFNRRRGWNVDWDDWDRTYGWDSNIEYIMTTEGLKTTSRLRDEEEERERNRTDSFKANIESNGVRVKIEGKVNEDERRYRYRDNNRDNNNSQDDAPARRDTTRQQDELSLKQNQETTEGQHPDMVTPLYLISRFAR